MTRYQPPGLDLDRPNPFPNIRNPRTREVFTPSELAEMHFDICQEILWAAHSSIESRIHAEVPDFDAIWRAAEEFVSLCLFDALNVAQANAKDPGPDDAKQEARSEHYVVYEDSPFRGPAMSFDRREDAVRWQKEWAPTWGTAIISTAIVPVSGVA